MRRHCQMTTCDCSLHMPLCQIHSLLHSFPDLPAGRDRSLHAKMQADTQDHRADHGDSPCSDVDPESEQHAEGEGDSKVKKPAKHISDSSEESDDGSVASSAESGSSAVAFRQRREDDEEQKEREQEEKKVREEKKKAKRDKAKKVKRAKERESEKREKARKREKREKKSNPGPASPRIDISESGSE